MATKEKELCNLTNVFNENMAENKHEVIFFLLIFKLCYYSIDSILMLLIKTTAALNEIVLSSHKVRGLYFMAIVFVTTILQSIPKSNSVFHGCMTQRVTYMQNNQALKHPPKFLRDKLMHCL